MSHFKKVLSLVSVFVLMVLAGFSVASETKAAETSTDTEATSTQECAQEGEMAQTTVSPDDQTECCEGLESIHPYDYEDDSAEKMTGTGSLCYDPEQGTPECYEDEEKEEEGWYYPEGELLMEFECMVEAEEEEENMETKEETSREARSGQICTMEYDPVCGVDGTTYSNSCKAEAAGVEIDYEGKCGEEKYQEQEQDRDQERERERIHSVKRMRYYKDIIKKEDGGLYGVKKDQEIVDRIKQGGEAEEDEDKEEEEGEESEEDQEKEKISSIDQMKYYKDIEKREDGALYGVKKDQEIIDRIKQGQKAEQERKEKKEKKQAEEREREQEKEEEKAEKQAEMRERAQERKQEIEQIRKNVDSLMRGQSQDLQQKVEELESKLEKKNEIIEEQQEKMDHVAEVLRDQENLSDNIKVALSEFISEGTEDNSKKIGKGERAAVINSYKQAFGHVPQNEEQLEDAIKISNGRFPSQKSEEAEQEAKTEFERIYNREPNMENANDKAAINIMAYGMRQRAQNRNMEAEQEGIETFEDIYGHRPQNTQEWNIMQAITYSGAQK